MLKKSLFVVITLFFVLSSYASVASATVSLGGANIAGNDSYTLSLQHKLVPNIFYTITCHIDDANYKSQEPLGDNMNTFGKNLYFAHILLNNKIASYGTGGPLNFSHANNIVKFIHVLLSNNEKKTDYSIEFMNDHEASSITIRNCVAVAEH